MQRFKREQQAIQALEEEAEWLVGVGWAIEDSRLLYRFQLKVNNEFIPLTLRYGHGFPAVPPSIFPDPPRRLSGHQYVNGDLCLEYGPDTWLPEVTGADLVRSAFGLLSGEAPTQDARGGEVASRHELTIGQAARSESARFVLTAKLREVLERAPRGLAATARFRLLFNELTAVFFLVSLDGFGEVPWTDGDLPSELKIERLLSDGAFVTIAPGVDLPSIPDRAALDEFLLGQGITALDVEVDKVLVHTDAETRLLWFYEGKQLSVLTLRANPGQRLPPVHSELKSKKVGIVGCGSLGSKIAVVLARTGVENFVLVDDDVFLPENLVRNELVWSDVGQHKAEAVAKRIELVNAGAKVTVRKQKIAGQESNSIADSTIALLQGCDLIVDATADPTVFNVLSGAAMSSSKALVWAEVFAGGIGGLIARSRPGIDPTPQTIRASISAWCSARDVAPPRSAVAYGAITDEGTWIADDADVTAIAAHAARFAVDLLVGQFPSAFPHSCYLLGLAQGWLFQAPFDTIPIDLSTLPASVPPPLVDNDPETLASILDLMTKGNAEPRPAS
jgi:molybdopterin/thiamine biosynthesis adenylyltransferase